MATPSESTDPLNESREHVLLIGFMLNVRATVARWRRDELDHGDAIREIVGNLRAYDEAVTDA